MLELCLSETDVGGLGLGSLSQSPLEEIGLEKLKDVTFLVEAWLQALNSVDDSRRLPDGMVKADCGRRPMTLSEKIFVHHATGAPSPAGIKPGDLIRVSVDWVIASELSWVVSKRTFSYLSPA